MIRQPVFVDTSFWAALFNRRDDHYKDASSFYSTQSELFLLFTSEVVLFETITYFNCSLKRHDMACDFYTKMRSMGNNILSSSSQDAQEALNFFFRYSDVALSMADCLSFALMRRLNIQSFLGYDAHFRMMGFLDALAVHPSK